MTRASVARIEPAYPPRGMSEIEAARYYGVSPSKFRELVNAGRLPQPYRVDRRCIWDRVKLDHAIDALSFAEETVKGEWD